MAAIITTQVPYVATRYASLLGIKVTASSLKTSLERNPFYPGMRCLTTTFQEFNIPCNAFKLEAGGIHKLPLPFLSFQKINKRLNDFVLVTHVSDAEVTYEYETHKPVTVSRSAFNEAFQGYVFVAEAGPNSGEAGFEKKQKQEQQKKIKQIALLAGALFIFITSLFANGPVVTQPRFILPLLLKLAGCTVTGVLLLYEVDRNNALVRKICESDDDEPSHCDAVLNSDASKIFGISLAEVGFFFYSATTLFFLFPGLHFDTRFLWLSWCSIIAAPFILFSLYYQWRVVKQWCKLCLATQAILAGEFISYVFLFRTSLTMPELTLSSLGFFISCVALPVVVWYALKPVFSKAIEAAHYKPAYYRVKNHPDYFFALMKNQASMPEGAESIGLVYGNASGKTQLTFISNPFCKHCSAAHRDLEQQLTERSDIQVRMIFPTRNREDKKTARAVKHLMSLAGTFNKQQLETALHEWFSNTNYETFASKYPVNSEMMEAQGAKLEAMHQWCAQANIQGTPAFFLNGVQVPDDYSVREILQMSRL